jgi:hypothetical protein
MRLRTEKKIENEQEEKEGTALIHGCRGMLGIGDMGYPPQSKRPRLRVASPVQDRTDEADIKKEDRLKK